MMQKTLDATCEFENFHSKCRLRIYEAPDQRPIAIVTELAGNPGTTITNAAGYLAAMISERINNPLQNLIWIEHHRAGEGRHEGEESFDRVTFLDSPLRFDNLQRRPLTRAEVETLVGQPIA